MFKEFFQAFIKKFLCCHDWTAWKIVEINSDWNGQYSVYHLRCKKCGKLKKVKSH